MLKNSPWLCTLVIIDDWLLLPRMDKFSKKQRLAVCGHFNPWWLVATIAVGALVTQLARYVHIYFDSGDGWIRVSGVSAVPWLQTRTSLVDVSNDVDIDVEIDVSNSASTTSTPRMSIYRRIECLEPKSEHVLSLGPWGHLGT